MAECAQRDSRARRRLKQTALGVTRIALETGADNRHELESYPYRKSEVWFNLGLVRPVQKAVKSVDECLMSVDRLRCGNT